RRPKIHDAQPPPLRQLVAIGVGLREVVNGVEEQHRNVRTMGAEHVEHDDVFSLEAARDARRAARLERVGNDRLRSHTSISSRARRTASTASVGLAAPRAAWARRSATPSRSMPTAALASAERGRTIIPAPAVNEVIGSITMKLPVPR